MDLALTNSLRSFPSPSPSPIRFPIASTLTPRLRLVFRITASSTTSLNPITHNLKLTARAIVFSVTAASLFTKFQQYPAIAQVPQTLTQEITLLESNPESIDALQTQLKETLEAGDEEQSLIILKSLVSAQPEQPTWKFQTAKLLSEMGNVKEAQNVYEEILEKDPLSIEALSKYALLLNEIEDDREMEVLMKRLSVALKIAEDENKASEVREVKLIIAELEFMLNNNEEALRRFEELSQEDPNDYRPYFSKGVIYSSLGKIDEARVEFNKFLKLSGQEFDVHTFLKTVKKLNKFNKILSEKPGDNVAEEELS